MAGKGIKKKGITVSKDEDFSGWYGELVQKAELADLRYNIKGFVCYMPWAVMSIKKMFATYEKKLESYGHLPVVMPSLIPESNFHLEAKHVEGFTPEVFWVTEAGDGKKKFDERRALRPTSETALYKMYSLWIQSYNDLPFKRYQSGSVWRYETKMTRPFFRGREFHWIEAHNVFATLAEAEAQIKEDMKITHEMIGDEFAIPIIFFERPKWDMFPGAVKTHAADALTASGKVIQLPSTHLLGTNFSEPFDVSFVDKDGSKKYGYITCYGPAISRIYGAMIAIHGDDTGLVLPFELAPLQVVIVPILFDKTRDMVLSECERIKTSLSGSGYSVKVDVRDNKSPGEKFSEWEMKGVPVRIEVGPKDVEKGQAVVVTRHDGKKDFVKADEVVGKVIDISKTFTKQLKDAQAENFDKRLIDCESMAELEKAVADSNMVRCGFCSMELDGEACADTIKDKTGAEVRGKKVDKEDKKFARCVVCGKPAKETVYVAKSY